MPWHLDAAPLLAKHARAIDEKGASIYTQILFAVELLQLDHTEQLTQLLILVANELEGKSLLGLEVFVGLQAISGYAEDHGVGCGKGLMLITKVLPLCGAAWRVVLRIEVQD